MGRVAALIFAIWMALSTATTSIAITTESMTSTYTASRLSLNTSLLIHDQSPSPSATAVSPRIKRAANVQRCDTEHQTLLTTTITVHVTYYLSVISVSIIPVYTSYQVIAAPTQHVSGSVACNCMKLANSCNKTATGVNTVGGLIGGSIFGFVLTVIITVMSAILIVRHYKKKKRCHQSR